MTFIAEASSEEDFDSWVQSVKQSTHHLTLDEYYRLVEPSEYNPVALYILKQEDLFDRIIMQYKEPQ